MHTLAKRDGNCWVLNGTKAWVTNGIEGQAIIVIARSDLSNGHKGISAFIVPTNSPGNFKKHYKYVYFFDYPYFIYQSVTVKQYETIIVFP